MELIGIIGGKGLMGTFFKKVFERAGFRVIVSDANHSKESSSKSFSNIELAKKSDIVFFSVPIHKTAEVIREVLPYTREGQLLMDCTSIKTIPIKEMMKSHASVIGLHPMFRPSPMGLKNQTIVMCPARAQKSLQDSMKKVFTKEGARVVLMTPKQHDKLMSIIQVLLHFHTIVLGNAIRRLGVPVRATLKAASPIYRLEMDMIGRIFSQDPMLYGPIAMLNPETKKVISTLLQETTRMSKIVLKKDLTQFAKLFNKTSNFLGSFKKDALKEINHLLSRFK